MFLDILELTQEMRYSPSANKVSYIEKAITKIDKTKFLSEIAWENKLVTTREYSEFLIQLETIGRELGGWKRGLIKTPAQKREK